MSTGEFSIDGIRVYRRNLSFPNVLQCIRYIEDMKDARDRLQQIPRLANSRLMFWMRARIVILEQCMTFAARAYSRSDRLAIILFVAHMCGITESHYSTLVRDARILEVELQRRGL